MATQPYGDLFQKLCALPDERRSRLVVRSHPFGDILVHGETEVQGTVAEILGGPERIVQKDPIGDGVIWHAAGSDWQFVAYGLCHAAKGHKGYETALRDMGMI